MNAGDACGLIFIIYWGGAMLLPLCKTTRSTIVKSILDLVGNEWRVDRERVNQPGYVELTLSPVGDAQTCQRSLTLPHWMAKPALAHAIKVQVRS